MRPRRAIHATVAALAVALAIPGSAFAFTSSSTFDPDRFSQYSAHIGNKYLPMKPGTRLIYEGQVIENGETHSHRLAITVTNLTKVINGVRTRVFLERDFEDGELVEREIALAAEDTHGVVWYLGEYPEEFENGKFKTAENTWLAGVKGSRPGILMQAHPKVGEPEYRQGYAPSIGFDDRGKVTKSDLTVIADGHTWRDAIRIDERAANEPGDGKQLKFHVPGIGVVAIKAQGGTAQETMVLTRAYKLSAEEMRTVNETARTLNKRAYEHAPSVWKHTASLVRRG